MADDIDSIVKGAPMAGRDVGKTGTDGDGDGGVGAEGGGGGGGGGGAGAETNTPLKAGDPLSHTPSSPSMIYLNLLILEASLRAQYLELRARRRHHSFFLALLTIWVTGFGYAFFLAPREDGRGVGGSVYWGVELMEKLFLTGGIIAVVLVWVTGVWERGVRWPRRWFGVSNRGLRGFNCKLVIMRRPWWAEALATTAWFLTYGAFSNSGGSSYRHVDQTILREVDRELNLSAQGHNPLPMVTEDEERGAGHEEDLAPGGDYVKLLLLAKPFSPTFRENWELYRAEYWEKENERRALIRAKLKVRQRQLRRLHGGWFWWLPWRRAVAVVDGSSGGKSSGAAAAAAATAAGGLRADNEKQTLYPRHTAIEREHKRTRSGSVRRGSMSGTSSRSPTPTVELEEGSGGVTRKASTASNASDKRRKKVAGGSTRSQKRPAVESRSVTPEIPSRLASVSSGSSADTGRTLRNSGSKSGLSSRGQ